MKKEPIIEQPSSLCCPTGICSRRSRALSSGVKTGSYTRVDRPQQTSQLHAGSAENANDVTESAEDDEIAKEEQKAKPRKASAVEESHSAESEMSEIAA